MFLLRIKIFESAPRKHKKIVIIKRLFENKLWFCISEEVKHKNVIWLSQFTIADCEADVLRASPSLLIVSWVWLLYEMVKQSYWFGIGGKMKCATEISLP